MEIEKKFLLKEFPKELTKAEKYEIEQAYISRNPAIRIRRRNQEYFLTIKAKPFKREAKNIVISNEVELQIQKEEYESLLERAEGYLIQKTRYKINLEEGLVAEVDIFRERLSGLRFVEVEFPTIEMAEEFEKPSWFGRDISGDKRYLNAELSKLDEYRAEDFK